MTGVQNTDGPLLLYTKADADDRYAAIKTLDNSNVSVINAAFNATTGHDHNGTNSKLLPATSMTLLSGVYQPAIAGVTSVTAVTATGLAFWHRIGNQVFVIGWAQIDPTTTLTTTIFSIALPIASNFAASTDGVGLTTGPGSEAAGGGIIIARTAENDMLAAFFPVATSLVNVGFSFAYTVIP